MPKVQIWGYRCERCQHEWVPRDKAREPAVCPSCKSPYWNRPRQVKPEASERIQKDAKGEE
jgi:hypothetical protein